MTVELIYEDCDKEDYLLCVKFFEVNQVGDEFIPEFVREERFVGMDYGLCRMANVDSVTKTTDGGAYAVLCWKDGKEICIFDGNDFVSTDPRELASSTAII